MTRVSKYPKRAQLGRVASGGAAVRKGKRSWHHCLLGMSWAQVGQLRNVFAACISRILMADLPHAHTYSPYHSVDPAPPCADMSWEKLLLLMMETQADLYDRYRAMFALRNKGTRESVLVCYSRIGNVA